MGIDKIESAATFVMDNWDALGVTDHDGILHVPAVIKRRNAKGGIDETPVALRDISNAQRFKARLLARAYALELKLDLDRDARLVDDIENYAILTFAIREPRAPHDQHVKGIDDLLRLYDTQSLAELWGRYNIWVEMLDPRFGSMDTEDLWKVIARVATEKTPAPLAATPTHVQFTCIVLMAREALHSPNRPSWLPQPVTFKAVS